MSLKMLLSGLALSALAVTTPAHAYSQSGAQALQRVLKPHYHRIPITRKIRCATGDCNIVVFDNRGGDDVYRCTFLNYRGKRAMTCD